jgi:assimilatory nitrate reductase catalytic subunit
MQRARQALPRFAYATLNLYGRSSPLVVFRAATAEAISPDLLEQMDILFGLDGDEGAMLFADVSRRVSKKAISAEGRLLGVRLAGETLAQSWLKKAMAEDELAASLMRFALAPTAKPPVSIAPRNIICKCGDVSDVQINQALMAGADFSQLQAKFKCGTFCGSCVPDIKRMVAEHKTQETAIA